MNLADSLILLLRNENQPNRPSVNVEFFYTVFYHLLFVIVAFIYESVCPFLSLFQVFARLPGGERGSGGYHQAYKCFITPVLKTLYKE